MDFDPDFCQHGRRQFGVTYDIGVYMLGGTEILNGRLESTLISTVAHGGWFVFLTGILGKSQCCPPDSIEVTGNRFFF